MEAARELLCEEGLARLTTREVARRAGVSDASVFYHFQDKAGLLVSCLKEGLAPLKAVPVSLVPGETLGEALARMSADHEAFHDQAMPIFATVQSDVGLRREFAHRLLAGDHGLHRGVSRIEEQLGLLVQAGLIRADADLEAAAFLLIGSCFLRSWQRQLAGGRPDPKLPEPDRTVAALVELLRPWPPHENEKER